MSQITTKNDFIMTTQFETSKEYGNDLTIKIISRTEKTAMIETNAWGVKRVKLRKHNNGLEYISFKSWLIYATENFDSQVATMNMMERCYYS